MAPVVESNHHHRRTTKTVQKPFKSRFASHGTLKDRAKGKVESSQPVKGQRRTPHQQVMSKLARRNQAKQLRAQQQGRRQGEDLIFQGGSPASKHLAIVPLSHGLDALSAVKSLNRSVGVNEADDAHGNLAVRVERFRRNVLYQPATFDTIQALDVCRLTDWVVIVVDAEQTFEEEQDSFLKAIEGQGITNVVAVVANLDAKIPTAKRSRHLTDLKIALGRYFPALDKISNLDSPADCSNLVRSMCTSSTKGIRWRDDRSWMLIERVNWAPHADGATSGNPKIVGTVRGKGLNPDRLVHVPGWGDFQVHSIKSIPSPASRPKRNADEMDSDESVQAWNPSGDQDDLHEMVPEQADAEDTASPTLATEHRGVLLDDHHYFSDDTSHIPPPPKNLPEGTSNYQAAWFLDDVSDSDSEFSGDDPDGDVSMAGDVLMGPEDGAIADGDMPDADDPMNDTGPFEDTASEMHVEVNVAEEARQLEEYRANRKKDAEDNLEFPDEIELPPDVVARERLAKYRGLKNLRTSEWNHQEDRPYEPPEYKRLLQVADYKKSYNAVVKETLAGGVLVGTRVEVELRAVPLSFASRPSPTAMFSLLRHEHKRAVVNLQITLRSDLDAPLKSKDELILQIGHRRLVVNPIFSASGQTPNDVHKFDRYLHPGRTAIATFTGFMTWGSVPVLVFRRRQGASGLSNVSADTHSVGMRESLSSELELIGTATTLPPSSSRVVAKRVILTGHPFKIHKKLVTVRYMFFNRDDVTWFAALPLWTRRGRQGFIKEPLGTHGYFKATFDGKINPMDAIGVSLYKRVWPRSARSLEE